MSFDLEILVPDGPILQARVSALQAADASGRFGLLPGHQAFLTVLVPCVLCYRDEQGREQFTAVDGGVLMLEQGKTMVVTREAVTAATLDEVADAVARMLQVRRAQEQTARAAFAELETTLLQELGKVGMRA